MFALKSVRMLGSGQMLRKFHFRYESLKTKALFSETLGSWPVWGLNLVSVRRLNIYKRWEYKASGELRETAELSNCILT